MTLLWIIFIKGMRGNRRANIIDGFPNTIPGIIPFISAVIFIDEVVFRASIIYSHNCPEFLHLRKDNFESSSLRYGIIGLNLTIMSNDNVVCNG